jgi:peptidyl-prolyl cis-trans isomerase SurA
MIKNKNKIVLCLSLALCSFMNAQEVVIERVAAVIGNNTILQSELDAQYQQMVSAQEPITETTRCKVLEDLLYQKLLLAQAQKDSVDVTEAQVQQELDRRIRVFISQFGSEERFVQFYGKTVDDFKVDFHDNIRDILMSQQMQGKITGDITVTPADVRNFFATIPEDSLPFINAEVEVGQIVKKPAITPKAKKEAKEFIESLRQRIMKGESSFAVLAGLYSQDPGSSSKGGLYEHIQRGQFVPEWDAQAFTIKPNEISPVFETVYGFFIIQLVERRGEEVDARSLLITPKVEAEDLLRAKLQLDTIYDRLKADTISFAEAAARYSDDEETRNNGGLMVNPFTGGPRFEMDEIGQVDQNVAFAIDKLKVGEYTKPMPFTTHDGKQAYRILYLKTHTNPHKANLVDDYQKIQSIVQNKKQQEAIQQWIKKKISDHYIHVADDFKDCTFSNKWIN